MDADWTYVVSSEGLAPGESKSFTMMVKDNSSIRTCSDSIIDYD